MADVDRGRGSEPEGAAGTPLPGGRGRWATLGGAVLVSGAILVIVIRGSIGSGNAVPARLGDVVATMHATSARLSLREASNEPHTSVPGTITGEFDFRRGVGRWNVPAMSGSRAEEVLFVHRSTYSSDTTGIRHLPANAHWVLQTAAHGYGFTDGVLQFITNVQTGRHTRDLGETTVDSQVVRHYEALEATPSVPRDERPASTQIDLYVDAHNRVVRIVQRHTFKNKKVTLSAQFDFTDYDVPVNVVAPPADQVVKFP